MLECIPNTRLQVNPLHMVKHRAVSCSWTKSSFIITFLRSFFTLRGNSLRSFVLFSNICRLLNAIFFPPKTIRITCNISSPPDAKVSGYISVQFTKNEVVTGNSLFFPPIQLQQQWDSEYILPIRICAVCIKKLLTFSSLHISLIKSRPHLPQTQPPPTIHNAPPSPCECLRSIVNRPLHKP